MNFKIGDKVRFINENIAGIVSSIIDNNTIGVSTDDFEIPVPKNQVIKIKFDEALNYGEKKEEPSRRSSEKGFDENIFISFVQSNPEQMDLYLINHAPFEIFVHYYTLNNSNTFSKFFRTLEPFDYIIIDQFELSDFQNWPILCFQLIVNSTNKEIAPIDFKFKMPSSRFFKYLRATPLIQKQGYLFALNTGAEKDKLNELEATSFDTLPGDTNHKIIAPLSVVDLHIDKLHNNYTQLTKQETFQLQMKYFERQIEDAIASGMNKIIFIHGVGNLKLKNEIIKILSQNKHVASVKDASIQEFGYGATEVIFNSE